MLPCTLSQLNGFDLMYFSKTPMEWDEKIPLGRQDLSADSIIDGNGSRQSNGLIKTRMRYALRFDGFFKAWAGRLE